MGIFSRRLSCVSKDSIKRLHVYLIKPSKYDEEGYVIRYVRGVLPSNTLACLYSLTDDLRARRAFGSDMQVEITVLDETVQKIPVDRIRRRAASRSAHTRTLIALAGVQTNQFPRAADLALRFRESGLPVMIGGFHVTGIMALADAVPADIQLLIDRGVTIVRGEVEESWERLLRDAIDGRLLPSYDFTNEKPDLYERPIPRVHEEYMRRFVFKGFGTIDAGRGCPFDCSFCTIINVQGRKMRHRSAELIADRIRSDYKNLGIKFYFFTDDNFARNKNWEAILDAVIRLRREEGLHVEFMMQVDVLSYKIPGFIAKAKDAGCSNVFIGMESINPKNLAAAGKTQNDADDFKNLIAAWQSAGIITHVGYIIGFPHDSPESVREDIKRLKDEVKVDMASFFVLTPLPGSADHANMLRSGTPMEPDYNRYDSFRETLPHPNFKPGELLETYKEAWRSFYDVENMSAVLARAYRGTYWDLFKSYVWYKNALSDGQHPMISGFFRIRNRRERRPGLETEGRLKHMRRRLVDVYRFARDTVMLAFEMEEVWLNTRGHAWQNMSVIREMQHRAGSLLVQIRGLDARELRQKLIESLFQFRGKELSEYRAHLDSIVQRIRDFDARGTLQNVSDQLTALQKQIDFHERLRGGLSSAAAAHGRGLAWFRRLAERADRLALPKMTTREPLARFWSTSLQNLRRGRIFKINPARAIIAASLEARALCAFAISLVVARFLYDHIEG